jgi:hypothetical protein
VSASRAGGVRLAVIGAGPVGLEMALAADAAGCDARVYEAGRVGAHLRRFAEIPLFTPFAMNSTAATRARLRRAGVALPSDDALLTAGELVARYLEPVAALPELRGRIHESRRVAAVARDDRAFVLRIESPEGSRFDSAEIVVDASGVAGRPLFTGPGGIAAIGEDALGDRVDRHLLPTREAARARFGGRRVLLIGSGHSAATALAEFDAMAREGSGPERVSWVRRGLAAGPPFAERDEDPLPERRALEQRANAAATRAPWLSSLAGCAVLAYEPFPDGSLRVRLRTPGGADEAVVVDRVLALCGYRPDTDLYRELRVHLCYDTEAPMALAAALLAARTADPARSGRSPVPGDCLTQTTHGPETLRTTEPGFYVIGAKSYGRAPDFLLRVGYEQVQEVAVLLSQTRPETLAEASA